MSEENMYIENSGWGSVLDVGYGYMEVSVFQYGDLEEYKRYFLQEKSFLLVLGRDFAMKTSVERLYLTPIPTARFVVPASPETHGVLRALRQAYKSSDTRDEEHKVLKEEAKPLLKRKLVELHPEIFFAKATAPTTDDWVGALVGAQD